MNRYDYELTIHRDIDEHTTRSLSDPTVLMSLIIFLPTVAAFVLLFFPKGQDETMKQFSFITTIIVFALTVWIALPGEPRPTVGFSLSTGQMQYEVSRPWIPAFDINYHLGLDGISLPLVVLTSFLSVLAMWASWPIQKHVRAYCILFLLLETGMLGVFMSLDFFLFYVFWEVMLLPMYFLIGVWGGPRREYAAIKFFLFTLVGSVLMLIALLMLYFTSDARLLDPGSVAHTHVQHRRVGPSLGQMANSPFAQTLFLGHSVGWWAFLLLFVGFVIKLPAVPVHTWLPDAHVEAPTPISMILAGVLLKMGGYGVLRICYPILPSALDSHLTWMVAIVGVVSMVYGAFAAMAQKDFKRLVAYSSVSHMGYVLLGHRRVQRHGRQPVQYRRLADGRQRRHVPDDRPRHQLGWHVLPGRRRLRPRPPSRPRPLRRAVPAHAHLRGHFHGDLLRRPGPAGALRVHRRSARRAFGLELQHGAGRDFGRGRDPHRRLHPLDDPAGLPGTGVQGPARRGPAADDPA